MVCARNTLNGYKAVQAPKGLERGCTLQSAPEHLPVIEPLETRGSQPGFADVRSLVNK